MGTAYSPRGLPLGHQWRLSREALAGKKGRPLAEVVRGGKGPSADAGTEAQTGIKGKKKTGRGWGRAASFCLGAAHWDGRWDHGAERRRCSGGFSSD